MIIPCCGSCERYQPSQGGRAQPSTKNGDFMCLLPLPNLNFESIAYKKGVREFDCRACPECLQKLANSWVLRSVFEARSHAHNCMITLTYDTFVRDDKGRILKDKYGVPLENPVDPDLKVNKRDVQLFVKRLRKWYSKISDDHIKVLVGAEYGSKTHRAHYHLILFGVMFPDLVPYKKSKRGNQIYFSHKLSALWNHGICTVDSTNIRSSIARYCTKYCAKSRSQDTFMLFSKGIGSDLLYKHFNGLSYFIDGREYAVPRMIWERYIVDKYQRRFHGLNNVPLLSPKYVNRDSSILFESDDWYFIRSQKSRAFYRRVRDRDPLYVNYLSYWQSRGQLFESRKLPARQRIIQLSDSKYHFYKAAALRCLDMRNEFDLSFVAPGSNCISALYHDLYSRIYAHDFLPSTQAKKILFDINYVNVDYIQNSFAVDVSCPNTANDTESPYFGIFGDHILQKIQCSSPFD